MTKPIITDEGDFIYFTDLDKNYRVEPNNDELLEVNKITLDKTTEQEEDTYRVTNKVNIN